MIEINGHTKTCGLLGNPVEHTLSPIIHNTIANELGHNLVYLPFFVPKDKLSSAVDGIRGLSLYGLNVTVPYKSEVIPLLDEVDSLASKIGAVNTIVRENDGLKGYNTDMPGLLRALESENIRLKGKEVVVLGAGGVSRAVCMLCATEQVAHVYLLNRTLENAKKIADEIEELFGRNIITPMILSDYNKLDGKDYICIQGTSVGLAPNVDQVVIEDEAFYKKLSCGVDLIYNPLETKFMKLAKKQQVKTMNGLSMLLYQGIIAYELWNHCEVSDTIAKNIYAKLLGEL